MKEFLVSYWVPSLIVAVIAYLIGGINSSLVVTKILEGKDIRTLGSGNAGFTNALRTVGKKIAILSFVGDFTKGILAVWIAVKIASFYCLEDNCVQILKIFMYLSALMCVLGHIFPCFFRFKGGKGILTAWSCGLLIDWRVFIILISIFLVIFSIWKIISLASIFAAISYPIATFFVGYLTGDSYLLISVVFTTIIGSIVFLKHISNLKRIINGTESKITIHKTGVV